MEMYLLVTFLLIKDRDISWVNKVIDFRFLIKYLGFVNFWRKIRKLVYFLGILKFVCFLYLDR